MRVRGRIRRASTIASPMPSAPTTPMLRMFAPRAVMPPSANTKAWPAMTTAITMQASHGPEQDRGERAAQQVAAGAAGHREVEHLHGEDERGRDAEQGHLAVVERPSRRGGRRRPTAATAGTAVGGGHGSVEEPVRDVHGRVLSRGVRRSRADWQAGQIAGIAISRSGVRRKPVSAAMASASGREGRVVQVLHGAALLADDVVVAVLARHLEVEAAGAEVGAPRDAGRDQRVERAVDRRGVDRRVPLAGVDEDVVGGDVVAAAQRLKDQQALGGGTTSGASQERGGGIPRAPSVSQLQLCRRCGRMARRRGGGATSGLPRRS